MRKVAAGLLISLNSVVESPDTWGWSQYMNDEMIEGIVAGIAQLLDFPDAAARKS